MDALTTFVLVAAALLGLAALLAVVVVYNALVQLRNNIAKAWSNIDVLLRQRAEEVPNLVRTVQGYAAHERAVLRQVGEARAAMLRAEGVPQKAQANNVLAHALRSLFLVAEAYPQLQASSNFLALQRRLSGLEDEIADRREYYNDAVTRYNTRIATFPDLLVARPLGFRKPMPLFQAKPAERAARPVGFRPARQG